MLMAQNPLWVDITFPILCLRDRLWGIKKKKNKVKNSKNNSSVSLITLFGVSCQIAYHPLYGQLINTELGSEQWGYKETIILTM